MMSAGVPVRKPPAFTASSMRGNLVAAASFGSRIAAICSSRERPHQAQLAKHLHVFFVVFRRLAHAVLAALGDVELEAERQLLAEFELDAATRVGGLEPDHVPLDSAALGRAAADHARDAVLGHEVESALRAALDRLPAFDRQTLRRRNQGDLLKRVAAIRHLRRDRVVLALVRERLALERLEQDVDALFEDLAVGVLVGQRRAEGLDLAGVIAAGDAKDHPPAAEDVGHRVVFGEAQRVPHRHDVEAAADLQVLGLTLTRCIAIISRFGISSVPSGWKWCSAIQNVLKPRSSMHLAYFTTLCSALGQLLLRIAALVDRRAGVAEVLHVGGAVVGAVEFRDHRCLILLQSRCFGSARSSGPAALPSRTISIRARRSRRARRQSGTRR